MFCGGFLCDVLAVSEISNAWGAQLVFFIGFCIGTGYLINMAIGWLPAYLYIRLTLSTKVGPSDAKALAFLFKLSSNGKWYPLLEIKKLNPEDRREALFQFAKKVATKEETEVPK